VTSSAKDFIFHAGTRDKFSRLKANEALLHPFITRKQIDPVQVQRLFEPSPEVKVCLALKSLL
jgi:serine/threonine protein kinase